MSEVFTNELYVKDLTEAKLKACLPFAVSGGEWMTSGPTWDVVIIPPNKKPDLTVIISFLPVVIDLRIYFANVSLAISAGAEDGQLWTAIVRCDAEKAALASNKFTPLPWPQVTWA